MKHVLIAVVLFSLCGLASAGTKYVSPNGSSTSPYDTWAKAATNLQDAMVFVQPEVPAGGAGQMERLETWLTPSGDTTAQGWMAMRHRHVETNSVPLPIEETEPGGTP
jgi:hypothetical protein